MNIVWEKIVFKNLMSYGDSETNFYFNKSIKPEYLNTITCKTCHRGEAFPPED